MKPGSLDYYSDLWDSAKISNTDAAIANVSHGRKIAIQNRMTYQAASDATGVPWYVIAAIHIRECNGDFTKALCNGQQIIGSGKKTTITPIGRGPYPQWLDSAIDAMSLAGFTDNLDWTIENILRLCERYNGLGYLLYHPSVNTPYLWSCTSLYSKGLFTSDGDFDSSAKDVNCGIAALLKCLEGTITLLRAAPELNS